MEEPVVNPMIHQFRLSNSEHGPDSFVEQLFWLMRAARRQVGLVYPLVPGVPAGERTSVHGPPCICIELFT